MNSLTYLIVSSVMLWIVTILQLLQKVSRQLSEEDCSDALSEHNRDKNFSNKAIPCKISMHCSLYHIVPF